MLIHHEGVQSFMSCVHYHFDEKSILLNGLEVQYGPLRTKVPWTLPLQIIKKTILCLARSRSEARHCPVRGEFRRCLIVLPAGKSAMVAGLSR
jgi:hypothetical protein